jgi:hypothetical protein
LIVFVLKVIALLVATVVACLVVCGVLTAGVFVARIIIRGILSRIVRDLAEAWRTITHRPPKAMDWDKVGGSLNG